VNTATKSAGSIKVKFVQYTRSAVWSSLSDIKLQLWSIVVAEWLTPLFRIHGVSGSNFGLENAILNVVFRGILRSLSTNTGTVY
jgi:hypothetical protein